MRSAWRSQRRLWSTARLDPRHDERLRPAIPDQKSHHARRGGDRQERTPPYAHITRPRGAGHRRHRRRGDLPRSHAAAGEGSIRPGAGPAIILSFLLTGVVCTLTALCYAELAAMIPISGSAYTYAFATLGELVAWIIGWDLLIEYAAGNVAVAISWSGYFQAFLDSAFGVHFPAWLVNGYRTASPEKSSPRPRTSSASPCCSISQRSSSSWP